MANSKFSLEVDGVLLRRTSCEMLKILLEREEDTLYQRQIARELKKAESTIKYHADRLLSLDLIKVDKSAYLNFFYLTNKGKKITSKILDTPFENIKLEFRCHRYVLTSEIICKPQKWNFTNNVFKAVSDELHMTNWRNQREGRWGDNFFLISDSSISLRIDGNIINPNPHVGAYEALDIFIKFVKDLELCNPELKLGKPKEGAVVMVSSQEYAIRLPNIREFIKPVKTEVFSIDWSKNHPEIDFIGSTIALDNAKKFHDFIILLLNGAIDLELLKSKNLMKIYKFCKIATANQSGIAKNSPSDSSEHEQSRETVSSSSKSQEEPQNERN